MRSAAKWASVRHEICGVALLQPGHRPSFAESDSDEDRNGHDFDEEEAPRPVVKKQAKPQVEEAHHDPGGPLFALAQDSLLCAIPNACLNRLGCAVSHEEFDRLVASLRAANEAKQVCAVLSCACLARP